MTNQHCVGIDLGTTVSSIAYLSATGDLVTMVNEEGGRVTPSFISFSDKDRLIGIRTTRNAQNTVFNFKRLIGIRTTRNAQNTVFNFKRLIGRRYDDPLVQNYVKSLPFTILKSSTNTPLIQVSYNDETKIFLVEEITCMLLKYLQSTARTWTNSTITDCVISVPATFNYSQRKATADAAKLAGLNVLQLINEPTAIAITYAQRRSNQFIGNILIIDFGGGTFDVSVISIDKRTIKVLSTAGSTDLGGDDLDSVLANHLVKRLKSEYNLKHLERPLRAKSRLKIQCERAKRTLSHVSSAIVEIDELQHGIDFVTSVTRERYADLCSSYFESCIDYVKVALNDSGLGNTDIDDVVLAGGVARDAIFGSMINDYFADSNLQYVQTIAGDTAVVRGAAIQAAILNGDIKERYNIIDIVPSSVQFINVSNNVEELISNTQPLPCKVVKNLVTTRDNQHGFDAFSICEDDCNMYKLDGIPQAPKGSSVAVVLDVNASGLLSVSGNCNEILSEILMNGYIRGMKSFSHQYISEDIIRIIVQYGDLYVVLSNAKPDFKFRRVSPTFTFQEMKKRVCDFQKWEERLSAKHMLEEMVKSLSVTLENEDTAQYPQYIGYKMLRIRDDDKIIIQQIIEQHIDWMGCNLNATANEYETKQKEIDDVWKPILQRYRGDTGTSLPTSIPVAGMPAIQFAAFGMPIIDDVD
eukprot:333850_1